MYTCSLRFLDQYQWYNPLSESFLFCNRQVFYLFRGGQNRLNQGRNDLKNANQNWRDRHFDTKH